MTMKSKVTELRNEYGLTQTELADKADVGRSLIQSMERGEVPKRRSNIRKVADAFGVTIDELLDGDAAPAEMPADVWGAIVEAAEAANITPDEMLGRTVRARRRMTRSDHNPQ